MQSYLCWSWQLTAYGCFSAEQEYPHTAELQGGQVGCIFAFHQVEQTCIKMAVDSSSWHLQSIFILLLLNISAPGSTCQQNCSFWFQIWWDPLLNWGKGRENRGTEDHFDLLGSQIRSLSDNWYRQRTMSCITLTLSSPFSSLDLEVTLF